MDVRGYFYEEAKAQRGVRIIRALADAAALLQDGGECETGRTAMRDAMREAVTVFLSDLRALAQALPPRMTGALNVSDEVYVFLSLAQVDAPGPGDVRDEAGRLTRLAGFRVRCRPEGEPSMVQLSIFPEEGDS